MQNLYNRKACKPEEKKCKIRANKFYKTVMQGKCIFSTSNYNTKHIGVEKNLLHFGVCTFHDFI